MGYSRRIAALFALSFVVALVSVASETIYDEKADAHKQVAAAIEEASRSGKNIVLIFGANW